MAEAINGDMLLQKEAGRPSDTVNPLTSHSGYFLPAMLRVDSNGNTRWGRTFQHVNSLDSGLYHSFNDISVAPDGRIVMGGYLRSRYPVAGYDTLGTVSWLVILNDTLHDHQGSTNGINIANTDGSCNISIYPNPTINQTILDVQNFKGHLNALSWQLCDLNGRILESQNFKSLKTVVNLRQYAAGIYFIKIKYQGKTKGTEKIVKY